MLYERRRPESGTLHRVVRENLKTLYAATEDGDTGAALPGFVRRELEAYLDCGLLCRGFALVACTACDERRLVGFSCKTRGFCPSCLGRRMAQTACNLLDHVLPLVPLRQWVLTVPHQLRPRMAYNRELLAKVGRIFVSSVLGFYRRRLGGVGGKPGGQSGAVMVVQRTSSDLKLNPHFHAVLLDGVYLPGPDGQPVFTALPRLSSSEVADVVQTVRARVPANPRGPGHGRSRARRSRHHLGGRGDWRARAGPGSPGGGRGVGACACRSREALVKYLLRPPIADEHLQLVPDDLVRIQLKRPFRDGTYAVDLDPLSLLTRLAAGSAAAPAHRALRRRTRRRRQVASRRGSTAYIVTSGHGPIADTTDPSLEVPALDGTLAPHICHRSRDLQAVWWP